MGEVKKGFQTPRVKHWCDGCDGDMVEDGKKCRRCGKKQLRKKQIFILSCTVLASQKPY